MQNIRPILHAEISALLSRLYRALDAADGKAAWSCFAHDATWFRQDGPKSGEAAIRRIVEDRPVDRTTSHIPSNLVLFEQEDGLTGRYYLTVYGAARDTSAHLVCCWDCEDRFVETADGYRLAEKRTAMRMKFA